MRVRVAVVSIVALAVMAYVSPPTVSADPVAPTALVLKVGDGDTIDIRDDSRGRLRVRLLGIDTPETDPTQDRIDRYGRTFGRGCPHRHCALIRLWGAALSVVTT